MRFSPLLKSRVCGFVAATGMTDNRDRRQSRRYLISGMVQGVGYRYFATRAAERLGVAGYAKNLHDGRVEVYAVSSEPALAQFRADLERGPQGALVSSVSEEEAPLLEQFSKRFSIEH
jgi:acylphosphatase